jgi:cytochrome b561
LDVVRDGADDDFDRMAVRILPEMVDLVLLPLPVSDAIRREPSAGKAIDGLHQAAEWTLLVLVTAHVLAALVHLIYYRDRVMNRMLPS